MRRELFDYSLPNELIARQPASERRGSRLLHLDSAGEINHRQFAELVQLIEPDDLLVFNNTRVIPARLFGQKETGGRIEVLIERITSEYSVLAHVRASKSPKPETRLYLAGDNSHQITVDVCSRKGDLFELQFCEPVLQVVEQIGHMPLPPYIDREDMAVDRERYQTVYASQPGAVAAPTAGLHFDEAMLGQLQEQGVEFAHVTLHVGAGTFQPVRVDNIQDHQMHSEWLSVSQAVCDKVVNTRNRGGRVIAVGTTSVRCLETAAVAEGVIAPYEGETDIFIYPGYDFKLVDALLTNFHLPESTLLMLVCAFAGYREVMQAYQSAVEEKYRFFSYGDAMFLTKNLDINKQVTMDSSQ